MIYLNFFEQELRRIVGPVDPDATYMGRACFIQVSEQNRAKLQFTTLGIRDRYEAPYRPTARDYAALTKAVGAYLDVFQDMRQEQGQTMGQMMG